MSFDDLLHDRLHEPDGSPITPDADAFARRLVRHDRIVIARRISLTGITLAVALIVALNAGAAHRRVEVNQRPAHGTATSAPTTVPPTTNAVTNTTTPLHVVVAPTTAPASATTSPAPATTALPAPTTVATPAPTTVVTPPTTVPARTTPTSIWTSPSPTWYAYATYGSGAGDGKTGPYDIYYGRAKPGLTITGNAPGYAFGQTTADANGHWSMKIIFHNMAVGQTVTMWLASQYGASKFLFTRTAS